MFTLFISNVVASTKVCKKQLLMKRSNQTVPKLKKLCSKYVSGSGNIIIINNIIITLYFDTIKSYIKKYIY